MKPLVMWASVPPSVMMFPRMEPTSDVAIEQLPSLQTTVFSETGIHSVCLLCPKCRSPGILRSVEVRRDGESPGASEL